MSNLFFIAGPSRVGKSIATDVIRKFRSPIIIQTDAVRSGVRHAFLKGFAKRINSVNIHIEANVYQGKPEPLPPRNNVGEDDYAWDGVLGIIAYYYHHRTEVDLLVEGVAITPERVLEIKKYFPDFRIRAAFVGYSKESTADDLIKYANEHHDHLWKDMQDSGKGEEYVREMVRHKIPDNEAVRILVEKCGEGFRYFDRSLASFDVHTQSIVDYLS